MADTAKTPGADSLTDVPGFLVGHAHVPGERALSGTTVVLAPAPGAVAGVDVRGGGPGTRETDALDPRNVVERIEAVVLTGGSAYGLDAAGGVMAWLEERGRGVRVGPEPHQVVPVVPAACVFDLGRGGDWHARPDAATGRAAAEAAGPDVAQGCVGAGTGAVAGGLKGGVGTASATVPSGATVGALVVVNCVGSVFDPATGALYGAPGRVAYPEPAVHEAAMERLGRARTTSGLPPLNTTLAVVATDAPLTGPQAQKLAGTSHDGLARAIRPVHLMHDGDTVFALATGTSTSTGTGTGAPLSPVDLNAVLAAGADVVARAVTKAVLAAEGVEGPGGTFPSYRDLYGS
ncbi:MULTISPECIES: P1 family peptidase [unclassified Streptomyces]|uniref:P1 family peptidase n=1 Tax=unclassified Streptomyces TaxID=2593676 RepID=UPI0033E26441